MPDNRIFDLDEDVARTPVSYKNRFGITIAADLYRPKDFDESQEHPAIVIGAPYGGVKEQGPGIYAQNTALRGFVALTFGPSFNGYSGGQPRHLSSPDLPVEDFSAAVDYLGTRPFVDRERIGGIGMCGSGGFLLSAAQVDRRLKAVATVSMVDIARTARCGIQDTLTEEDRNAFLGVVAEQRYAEFEGNPPALTRAERPSASTTPPTPSVASRRVLLQAAGYHPNSITQFTLTSSMSFINLPLLTHIKPISPRPILLVVGEYAHSRYFSEDACELASDPKELYVVPNAGHGDLYDKTDLMPFDKLAEFFTKHLASNPDLAVAGASLDGQGEAVPDGYRAMADRESIKVRVTPWAAPALPERALASPRGRPSHFR